MGKANLLIVGGTLLLALGGLVATYGWNLRSSAETRVMMTERADNELASRRRAALDMLAAEFSRNTQLLTQPPIAEPDPEKIKKFVPLPHLHDTALSSAIASGLFSQEPDKELFSAIIYTHEHVTEFNDRLAFTETQMVKGEVGTLRTTLRDGATLKGLIEQLSRFAQVLLRNGVNPDRSFLGALESAPTVPEKR